MRLALAILFLGSTLITCSQPSESSRSVLGNEKLEVLIPILGSKSVAVVGNHTSVLKADIIENPTHLVDTLLSLGVNVVKAFAPEHGFRGNQANGANIVDGVDTATGLCILSLHGKHRKPSNPRRTQIPEFPRSAHPGNSGKHRKP